MMESAIRLVRSPNPHAQGSEVHSLDWFKNDAFPYIFMLALGVSNGYFGTLCMMYGPT